MSALGDVQGHVRAALLTGDVSRVASTLTGGGDPAKRFAIHQRHYIASLVQSLLSRFPATVWLVGSELVTGAAHAFVRLHPPTTPCIAEYGEDFPQFLAAWPSAADIAYLDQFGVLEWHVGRVSLAVSQPPLTMSDFAALGPHGLSDARLTLQPGVVYLHLEWGVDELMSVYMSGNSPERFGLEAGDVWLELRGGRGDLTMNRLTRSAFTFRSTLIGGATLGDAGGAVLDADHDFDAGQALLTMIAEGLITGVETETSIT